MKKLISLPIQVCLLVLMMAIPGRADAGGRSVQEHFKSSVNTMVQDVKKAENPVQKREIIGKFLLRMDRAMVLAKTLKPLSPADERGVASLRSKVQLQYDELNGLNGRGKVADADLNSYAGYLQQDLEQADAYWTDNGVYISLGTLLLILIIILILKAI